MTFLHRLLDFSFVHFKASLLVCYLSIGQGLHSSPAGVLVHKGLEVRGDGFFLTLDLESGVRVYVFCVFYKKKRQSRIKCLATKTYLIGDNTKGGRVRYTMSAHSRTRVDVQVPPHVLTLLINVNFCLWEKKEYPSNCHVLPRFCMTI